MKSLDKLSVLHDFTRSRKVKYIPTYFIDIMIIPTLYSLLFLVYSFWNHEYRKSFDLILILCLYKQNYKI